MDPFSKFLGRVDPKLAMQIRRAMLAIEENSLDALDIVPLQGHKDLFRCRVRHVRIIFQRTREGNVLRGVGFRKDVYKK